MRFIKLPPKRCASCRYFFDFTDDAATDVGVCRKRAPKLLDPDPPRKDGCLPVVLRGDQHVMVLGMPRWPAVEPDWVCGDFSYKDF